MADPLFNSLILNCLAEFAWIFAFLFAYSFTQNVQMCTVVTPGDKDMGVSPAPSADTTPQIHLTLSHLVFHKVLGKGSFGKVWPCNTWVNLAKTVIPNSVVGVKEKRKDLVKDEQNFFEEKENTNLWWKKKIHLCSDHRSKSISHEPRPSCLLTANIAAIWMQYISSRNPSVSML